MNIDFTQELLKKILWYQPKEAQHLIIPNRCNELVQRLELSNADSICGVKFAFGNVSQVTSVFDFNGSLECSKDRPVVSTSLLQCKHMGVVGYGMQHLMQLNPDKKYKKKVYEELTQIYSTFYCNYTPFKVSSTLNWGIELLAAYLSAKESIVTDLYVSTSNKQVPNNWDLHSRLMAGELLTELDVNIIKRNSRHLCKLSVIAACDYLLYNVTENSKSSFIRIARELNIPVIRVVGW